MSTALSAPDALTTTTTDSPLGRLTLTARDGLLTGLYLAGQRHHPSEEALGRGAPGEAAPGEADPAAFEPALTQLAEFFDGRRTVFDLPLAAVGTPFQREVWAALSRVRHGTTTTYARLAEAVGRPRAVRAVGAAVGRNPVSVVVPCHRVLGADGTLTGYAGGLDRKRWLLDHEARVAAA